MFRLLMAIFFAASFSPIFAQCSTLSGSVLDESTGEELSFAAVVLQQGDVIIASTESDFDGYYYFSNVPAGTYDLHCSYIGFAPVIIKDLILKTGQIAKQNIIFPKENTSGIQIQEIIVRGQHPLFRPIWSEVGSMGHYSGRAIRTRTVSPTDSYGMEQALATQKTKATKKLKTVKTRLRKRVIIVEEGPILPAPTTENKPEKAATEPFSTFSIDVDAASYTRVRSRLEANEAIDPQMVRIEELVNYFQYDYTPPASTEAHPFSVFTELSDCPWNKEAKLLHIGLQGSAGAIPPRPKSRNDFSQTVDTVAGSNYVFLLDVSGSMAGKPMELMKATVLDMVSQMTAKDRIAIVVYAGAAGLVLPATKGNEKEKITAALGALGAGGSTAGGAGILLAYQIAKENFIKGGNNRVVLATDGDFNVGISSVPELEKLIEQEREKGVFLTVLGLGYNSNDAIMETLADKGNGAYFYLDDIDEATRISRMAGTLKTIAKDVKIQVEFNADAVLSYRLVGYENRKLNKKDFIDDTKDAGELGEGHTVTALYELVLQPKAKAKDALLDLRLRYKRPEADTSILMEYVVKNDYKPLAKASDNLGWSAAVAGWAMLLRQSRYVGKDFSPADVLALAKSHLDPKFAGERKGFLELVRKQSEKTAK